MNNGKICVSVCAETADEFIENIKRAEKLADIIELRFDCLRKNELDKILSQLSFLRKNFEKPFLITFRPKEQGGKRELDFIRDRISFWFSCSEIRDVDFVDIEFDLFCDAGHNWKLRELEKPKYICSYHNFKRAYKKLNFLYERMADARLEYTETKRKADVIKIAVQPDDITDCLGVWELLTIARRENRQIIPIAMGEAGKWTRILGLAHGAFMTYAALDSESETAPGQISAKDLTEVYRVKELNEKTEVFGIIGGNTSYSMSPYIHNAAFKFHNLNSVFVPLQVKNLDEFMRRMVKPETREINLNFRGFAVTVPHKIEIMKYLDSIDETAEKIGAVNTISFIDGAMRGFNTDAEGFIQPLQNIFGDLNGADAAVIGAGGAARAVCYALKKAGANVTVYARNLQKAEKLKTDFEIKLENLSTTKKYGDFDILVNTTPLGTKGDLENQTPATAEQLEKLKLVYDLVYNPLQTKLMSEADKAQVPKISGLEMLITQAAAQQKIWTGLDAPIEEIRAVVSDKLQSPK
jgi:3-dehydroquinate dehydratase / shikimate dehydrogenase